MQVVRTELFNASERWSSDSALPGKFHQSHATNRNVKQNAGSCFAQRVMRVTIHLKRWEGRYALVCLNRGGAGRSSGSRR